MTQTHSLCSPSADSLPITLWSRYTDGAEPVLVSPGPVTVPSKRASWVYTVGSASQTRTYQSAKALLSDLTRHPQGRHWTFDRYFHLGRYESLRGDDSPTLFEILDPANRLEFPTQASITVLSAAEPVQLGIDLAKRGDEVAKLLFAGFGHWIHGQGYSAEDVLQEVYKGILIRNRGTCPFDPRKASFGHYVHLVAGCIMSNLHRKQGRMREKEQTGASGNSGEGFETVDVADSRVADQASITIAENSGHPMDRYLVTDLERYIRGQQSGTDGELALSALPLVQEGYGRAEIAERLGVSKAAVSRALTYLRTRAKEWQAL